MGPSQFPLSTVVHAPHSRPPEQMQSSLWTQDQVPTGKSLQVPPAPGSRLLSWGHHAGLPEPVQPAHPPYTGSFCLLQPMFQLWTASYKERAVTGEELSQDPLPICHPAAKAQGFPNGFHCVQGVPLPLLQRATTLSPLSSNLSWVLGFRQQRRRHAVAVAPNGHQRALQGRKRQAKSRRTDGRASLGKKTP